MKIALDPYMHRHLSLPDLCRKTAELGFEYLELSPREDFLPWWVRPRAHKERIAEFKKALRDNHLQLASLLPMYRWASPHEDERRAAVNYWKEAIQVAVEMGCTTMNSEFGRGPSPDRGHKVSCCGGVHSHESSEAAWWRSMEELVPVLESEGVTLNVEPHPEDWCEALQPALDMLKTLGSDNVKFLYCTPHTFYFGDDMKAMIAEAGSMIAHVHIAATYNHKASSGLRYIINPPGAKVTVHQHMDMHQGEIDWDLFFSELAKTGFDGIVTACVFGWEERADESGRFMRKEIQAYVDKHFR
ncbi:myo-inositol catabolism protein IolH [Pseudomonas sp. NFIX10]|uniref:sugar phosphate isomerase/epimerase family protein n=1 Tax=unclassified Pseudomonas TaxID=196821 RepID=UPI0008E832F5|nr:MULTISPECIES: sugar phosphate isomerase/epimerase [unclassified Pseudomonas]SFB47104.1 myo-inositol catabolism protein IolH [Pseudomonas sp. NFIX10]SFF20933.1 myo-inositol catabolism protein IolH [Pseudomonas sp. NFACC06-1]